MRKLILNLQLFWEYDVCLTLEIMFTIIAYDISYAIRWLSNPNFRARKMPLNQYQTTLWRQRQRNRLSSVTKLTGI